jgi:hypothetical protein
MHGIAMQRIIMKCSMAVILLSDFIYEPRQVSQFTSPHCNCKMVLNIQERSEIIALCTNENTIREVANIFNARHPDRHPQLAYSTVNKIWNLAKVNNENVVNMVLYAVNINPYTPTRALARDTNLSSFESFAWSWF